MNGAKSISSRSMIRNKIVEYKTGKVSLDELKIYTQPKFKDGVSTLDNCIYAMRYVDNTVVAEFGNPFVKKNKFIIPDTLNNIMVSQIYINDTTLNVNIISPIKLNNAVLGYDIIYSSCSEIFKTILTKEQKYGIYQEKEKIAIEGINKEISFLKDTIIFTNKDIIFLSKSQFTNHIFCFSKTKDLVLDEMKLFRRRHILLSLLAAISVLLIFILMQQQIRMSFFKKGKHLQKLVDEKTIQLNHVITELKESEEKFRTIANSAQDAIILINEKGEVIFWNDAAEKIFLFTREQAIGKDLHQLIAPKRYHQKQETAFKSFIESGKGNAINHIVELEALRNGGYEFPVELSLAAIKLNNKWHAIGVIRDISQRKINEEMLKRQNKELSVLNATKDKFFSIIAHDLMSPFTAMLGFSSLLKEKMDEFDKSTQKKYIENIHTSVQNTYKLLDNLLTWSRSQKGTMLLNNTKINLALLFKDVIDLLNQQAIKKNIKIKNNLLNDIYAFADKDMILTVIRNLVSNAIKFTHNGGEILINSREITENNNPYIEITVEDNGVGIDPEIKSKLFDISENSTSKGTDNEKGTGLGLIICKEFIDKNSGRIWVESTPGKGSKFIFTLPCNDLLDLTNKNR